MVNFTVAPSPCEEIAQDRPSMRLWAVNLAAPIDSLDDWLERLAGQARQSAQAGHAMLVLPEYSCAQWLHLRDAPSDPSRQIPWMAKKSASMAPQIQDIATETGIDILAGTYPWMEERDTPPNTAKGSDTPTNRAILCRRDGTIVTQDKLTLTPGERDPAAWSLHGGTSLTLFDWLGWRTAIVICLDIEQPSLAACLAPLDLDLILVPSMTAGPTGYARVHHCARARAIELMTTVAVVGTIGTQPDGTTNTGGAAIYGPCEPGLSDDGFLAGTGRFGDGQGLGTILDAHGLPLDTIRQRRHGGAEVWPGPWDANRIDVRTLPGPAAVE